MLPFRPGAQPESMLSAETDDDIHSISLLRARDGNQALRALPVLQKKLERAQTENNQLREKLEHATKIANEYNGSWVEEKKAVIQRVNADHQTIVALRNKIAELENEAALRAQTLGLTCQQRNEYQRLLAEKSTDLANKSVDEANLLKVNEELTARRVELDATLFQAKSNHKLQMDSSYASIQNLKAALEKSESDSQFFREEIKQLQLQLREVTSNMQIASQTATQLTQTRQTLVQNIEDLTSDHKQAINQHQAEMDRLKKSEAALKEEVRQLRAQLNMTQHAEQKAPIATTNSASSQPQPSLPLRQPAPHYVPLVLVPMHLPPQFTAHTILPPPPPPSPPRLPFPPGLNHSPLQNGK